MIEQNGISGLSLSYVVPIPTMSLSRQMLTASQAEGVQQAFQLDSLRASHPIEVPVKNALEVDQIFDHISYLKGSSVIRMLSDHLGRETFLRGVADYLKSHAYGMPPDWETFLNSTINNPFPQEMPPRMTSGPLSVKPRSRM